MSLVFQTYKNAQIHVNSDLHIMLRLNLLSSERLSPNICLLEVPRDFIINILIIKYHI